MANPTVAGFRWYKSLSGHARPVTHTIRVADDYGTLLATGDLIRRTTDGTALMAIGSEGSQSNILGLMTGVKQYWDGSVLRKRAFLPASISYDTLLERASIIEYISMEDNLFEVDADTAEGTSYDTRAEIEGLIGENADFVLGAANGNFPRAVLDISSHNTTSTLQFRIVGLKENELQDYSTTLRLKFIVKCNVSQLTNTTGV